jgi:hypothetical protein
MLDYFAGNYPADYLSDTVEALFVACRQGYRVEEVSTPMRERQAGSASTRSIRLLYHYVRVLLVLAVSAPTRQRGRK